MQAIKYEIEKKKFPMISIGCITYKGERISFNISLVKYF
jgi:hypothetical protein